MTRLPKDTHAYSDLDILNARKEMGALLKAHREDIHPKLSLRKAEEEFGASYETIRKVEAGKQQCDSKLFGKMKRRYAGTKDFDGAKLDELYAVAQLDVNKAIHQPLKEGLVEEHAHFNVHLAQERKLSGMEPEELAKKAGITVDVLVSLEKGRREPTPPQVVRLAAAFSKASGKDGFEFGEEKRHRFFAAGCPEVAPEWREALMQTGGYLALHNPPPGSDTKPWLDGKDADRRFGLYLKALREKHLRVDGEPMSQEQLAEAIYKTKITLFYWEKGDAAPQRPAARGLSDYLEDHIPSEDFSKERFSQLLDTSRKAQQALRDEATRDVTPEDVDVGALKKAPKPKIKKSR